MSGTQEALYKYLMNRYNPNKCLSNVYSVPGTVLDAGNTAMNKTVFLLLWYFHFRRSSSR